MAYQSILNPMPITGALTDTQLRASAVPVSLASTTITGTVTITGGLTDTQLRATAVPVSLASTTVTGTVAISAASLPLPAGAATSAKQPALGTAGTASTDVITVQGIASGIAQPVSGTFFQATQPVSIATDADTISSGTIAALNATVAVVLNGKSGMRVQITGTWVGTLQFEGTVDGTNWTTVNAVAAGLSAPVQTTTANGVFAPTPAGFAQFRINATAWTSGTATVTIRASAGTGGTYLNQSLPAFAVIPAFKTDLTTPGTTNLVAIGTGGTVGLVAGAAVIGALTANQSVNNAQIGGVAPLMGNGVTGTGSQRVTIASDNTPFTVNLAAPAATYSASISGLVPALTATDIFTITGSISKTIRVTKIIVNGVQTTAGQVAVLVIKRSTADTAGTSTAPTKVPYDSTSAAATAIVAAYTANPTLGTTVGTITANRLFVPGAASASDAQGLMIVSGDVGQQYMALRGAAENIAVNLAGVTVAGGAVNVTVEWTES